VEALTTNNVWAVGTDSYGPFIAHFDGSAWSTAPTPEWGRGGQLSGIDSAPNVKGISRNDTRTLWAAGYYFPGRNGSRTLIERAPSPIEGAIVGSTNVSGATISWFGPESGSVETDPYGGFLVGGLTAGTYLFTAAYASCTPDSQNVTVLAGLTLARSFHIDCDRKMRGKQLRRLRIGRFPP
jgi:hypothetical protein